MTDPNLLSIGTELIIAQQRGTRGRSIGTVDMISDEGNYVRISWHRVRRNDVISKQSPLWETLERET